MRVPVVGYTSVLAELTAKAGNWVLLPNLSTCEI